MNDRFDTGLFQHGKAAIGKLDAGLDLVEVVGQEFMAKLPRGAIHRPRFTGLLVKADTQAAAFLAQIAFADGVHHMRMFRVTLVNLGDFVGDDILVLHRVQRQVNPGHRAHFARPETAGIHHMLGMHRALVGDHIPCAIAALYCFAHHAMGFNRGAAHARGLCIGMGGARGIKMAVERIIKPAKDAVDIGHRRDFGDLLRGHDMGIKPHVAMLGALGQKHVKSVAIVRQRHAADVMQPAGHAGDLFKFLVEPDRIALKGGHVGIAIERVKPACGVPCASRGQFRSLKQHHVGPAKLGQVIKHRTADDTAADHDDTGGGFHGGPPCGFSG